MTPWKNYIVTFRAFDYSNGHESIVEQTYNYDTLEEAKIAARGFAEMVRAGDRVTVTKVVHEITKEVSYIEREVGE